LRSGGEVRQTKLGGSALPGESNNSRIFCKGEEIPGLPVSRIIGFSDAHEIGAIAQPDVFAIKLDRKRITYKLILASEGLWKIFSPSLVLKNFNLYRFEQAGLSETDKSKLLIQHQKTIKEAQKRAEDSKNSGRPMQ
jgi:serine/threonine protein phosphatase PrpC